MAEPKTITIEITGDGDIIEAALDSFVRQQGWTDTVMLEGETVPNPVSKADAGRQAIMRFIMENVAAYNGEAAAIAAKAQAIEASTTAMYQTVLTLTVE